MDLIREFTILIGESEYMPMLHIKTLKAPRKFLYSVSLAIFIKGSSHQIARIDNYHTGRVHHIHIFGAEGEEEKHKVNVKNLFDASDYLVKRCTELIIEYERKLKKSRG